MVYSTTLPLNHQTVAVYCVTQSGDLTEDTENSEFCFLFDDIYSWLKSTFIKPPAHRQNVLNFFRRADGIKSIKQECGNELTLVTLIAFMKYSFKQYNEEAACKALCDQLVYTAMKSTLIKSRAPVTSNLDTTLYALYQNVVASSILADNTTDLDKDEIFCNDVYAKRISECFQGNELTLISKRCELTDRTVLCKQPPYCTA